MNVRVIGIAALAATMFVSSTFAATDTPALRPLAPAKPAGVQLAGPKSDVVLLIVSDPALADGIAVTAPKD
jgi:hypothetical protein